MPQSPQFHEIEASPVDRVNSFISEMRLSLVSVCTFPGNWRGDYGKSASRWLCTLSRILPDGKTVSVETSYTMGAAHREWPTQFRNGKPCVFRKAPNLFPYRSLTPAQVQRLDASRPTQPELADVLYSMQADASCANTSFADFCADMGHNPDSIKDRETYFACQESGDKLRKLGLNLDQLATVFQDY